MQPVATHNAVFCIVCRLLRFVVDIACGHIVEAYSGISFVTALNVESNVSLPRLVG